MLEQGMVLQGRYEIKKILGAGGSSHVYFAYDRETRQNRAVKEVCKPQDGPAASMVRQETELVQKLRYPYFPEIVEVFGQGGMCYIVMEYLEGETLGQLLARTGPQPWEQVVRWARDMCLVLGYLHNLKPPVIYRDMKPDNIILQPGGNLRLIDFGAALECKNQGGEAISLGTRGYAAPEQLAGEAVDARTDIYCLGVTMYHLLSGKDPCQFPCSAHSVRKFNWRLPRKLARIVKKCTCGQPGGRYRSCEELQKALEGIYKGK